MFPLGGNYKRDNRFAKYNWECVVCRGSKEKDGILETQDHISIHCPGFSDLRSQLDLNSDLGLLEFYRGVMKKGREIEEMDPFSLYV